jgi:hypothetical protein
LISIGASPFVTTRKNILWLIGSECCQRVLTVLGDIDTRTNLPDDFGERTPNERVVVDDENAFGHFGGYRGVLR